MCKGRGEGPVRLTGLAAGGVPRGVFPLALCGHREAPSHPVVRLLESGSRGAGHEVGAL